MKKRYFLPLLATPMLFVLMDEEPAPEVYHYTLVDPAQAPLDIREQVEFGFNLMHQTQELAKQYVGNELNCNNCHFGCGNTFGGLNGSISLVGASNWYPVDNFTLKDRIDNCFKRSMNGHPPPADSKEMNALVAYITWISSNVPKDKNSPWRGLPVLSSKHTPNPTHGEKIYMESCAPCHGKNGEGVSKIENTLEIPPLWGKGSYNDGAGMNKLEKCASFVYYNMPFDQPSLTEKQALDVASFVIQQPRPHFNN